MFGLMRKKKKADKPKKVAKANFFEHITMHEQIAIHRKVEGRCDYIEEHRKHPYQLRRIASHIVDEIYGFCGMHIMASAKCDKRDIGNPMNTNGCWHCPHARIEMICGTGGGIITIKKLRMAHTLDIHNYDL